MNETVQSKICTFVLLSWPIVPLCIAACIGVLTGQTSVLDKKFNDSVFQFLLYGESDRDVCRNVI